MKKRKWILAALALTLGFTGSQIANANKSYGEDI